jgi:hypothetical protein
MRALKRKNPLVQFNYKIRRHAAYFLLHHECLNVEHCWMSPTGQKTKQKGIISAKQGFELYYQ